MAWELTDKPRTMRVTKALATEFANMDPAPRDRPLSERRLMVYQRFLKEGSFRPVTWAKAYCTETNGTYRVNGKHTSLMLSGLEEMPEFYVTIDTYKCDTLEDVARLYATFDSGMQARKANDIYMSFASTVPMVKDLPDKIIKVVPPAITYALLGQEGYNKSQSAERAEYLMEYPEFVVWLAELVRNGPQITGANIRAKQKCSHLLRMAVVGAMFGTWQKSVRACSEFWESVRDESDPTRDTAARVLARYLITTGSAGSMVNSAKKTASAREIYTKCIHAWNAYRRGDTTNLNYRPDKPVPTPK